MAQILERFNFRFLAQIDLVLLCLDYWKSLKLLPKEINPQKAGVLKILEKKLMVRDSFLVFRFRNLIHYEKFVNSLICRLLKIFSLY